VALKSVLKEVLASLRAILRESVAVDILSLGGLSFTGFEF